MDFEFTCLPYQLWPKASHRCVYVVTALHAVPEAAHRTPVWAHLPPVLTSEMILGPDQTLGSSGGFLLSPENFSSSANSEDLPRGRHPFPSHRIPINPIALFS